MCKKQAGTTIQWKKVHVGDHESCLLPQYTDFLHSRSSERALSVSPLCLHFLTFAVLFAYRLLAFLSHINVRGIRTTHLLSLRLPCLRLKHRGLFFLSDFSLLLISVRVCLINLVSLGGCHIPASQNPNLNSVKLISPL